MEGSEKRFHCTECSKSYSFAHKLHHHQTWGCRKDKQEQLDFARRPLSSNVFSFTSKEGEEDQSDGIDSGANVKPESVKMKSLMTCY